jgi:tripartite-type tricarboxylate transporter receptor subunit TctC
VNVSRPTPRLDERRRALRQLASLAALAPFGALAPLNTTRAAASDYPSQPITIVVVYPPGGGADIVARDLGRRMTEAWNVPVVVENRPGAGTTLAAAHVAKADPNGYTLLMTDVSFAIAPALYKKLPYDTVRDLAPISLTNGVADALVVNGDVPVHTVQELIAYARRNPGKLTYASAGNGTLNHLAPEIFKKMAGIDMTHVPYKGAIAALNDVMAGRCQVYVGALVSVLPQLHDGKIRVLAVTGAHRSELLPDVPTVAESGLPGYDAEAWYGLLAPSRTPPAIIDKLNREVASIMTQPDFRKRMVAQGNEVIAGTPAEFARFLQTEFAKWRTAVATAGASVD